ncbi:MAG: fold [Actinomycetota bacterium]
MVGERDEDPDGHDTVAGTAESLLTFENAALPLSVVRPAGVIVMANRAMRALLRSRFDDLVGKSMYDVIIGDPARFARVWEERFPPDKRVTPEQRMRLRCGDGSVITVRASSVLVTDSQGAVRYIVARAVEER